MVRLARKSEKPAEEAGNKGFQEKCLGDSNDGIIVFYQEYMESTLE